MGKKKNGAGPWPAPFLTEVATAKGRLVDAEILQLDREVRVDDHAVNPVPREADRLHGAERGQAAARGADVYRVRRRGPAVHADADAVGVRALAQAEEPGLAAGGRDGERGDDGN